MRQTSERGGRLRRAWDNAAAARETADILSDPEALAAIGEAQAEVIGRRALVTTIIAGIGIRAAREDLWGMPLSEIDLEAMAGEIAGALIRREQVRIPRVVHYVPKFD